MSTAAETHQRSASPSRWVLGTIEALVALSAAGGAAYGLSGAPGVKTSWLDGSPFSSYVVPSIVLLVAVGGSAAIAFGALVTGGRRAPALAILAGSILVGWIAVEVIWIPFSPLQPACLLAGVAMIALGLRISPRRSGGEAPFASRRPPRPAARRDGCEAPASADPAPAPPP